MADSVDSVRMIAGRLREDFPAATGIGFEFGHCKIHLTTNSPELVDKLAGYFAPFVTASGMPDIRVTALEMPPPDLGLPFRDWKRNPGKIGRKDCYLDLPDGRVCRKFRTGMQYLLGDGQLLVFGECLKNDNQVVNFLISQYINWLMCRDWVLCHAAAVARGGAGMAVAAFSGGGKSTLALHLMSKGVDFVSNDRTLIKLEKGKALLNGVPKQPRINPGTAINNPDLLSIIPEPRRRKLAQLPAADLWRLEEKYDADVEHLFRPGCFKLEAGLNGFLILNWRRQSTEPARFGRVDIRARLDLLAAVMKSPGPFHIAKGGRRPCGVTDVVPEQYLAVLSDVPVFEATGRVDFDKAAEFCLSGIL